MGGGKDQGEERGQQDELHPGERLRRRRGEQEGGVPLASSAWVEREENGQLGFVCHTQSRPEPKQAKRKGPAQQTGSQPARDHSTVPCTYPGTSFSRKLLVTAPPELSSFDDAAAGALALASSAAQNNRTSSTAVQPSTGLWLT